MEIKSYETVDSGSAQSLLESMHNLEPTPDPLEQFKATPAAAIEDFKVKTEILESTAIINSSWTEVPESSHSGKIDIASKTMELDGKPFLGGQAIIETILAKGSYATTFADAERGILSAAEYTLYGNGRVTLRIYEKPMDIFVDADIELNPETDFENDYDIESIEQHGDASIDDNAVTLSAYAAKRRSTEQRSTIGDGRIVEAQVVNKEVQQLSQETGIYLTMQNPAPIRDSNVSTEIDAENTNQWQAIAA